MKLLFLKADFDAKDEFLNDIESFLSAEDLVHLDPSLTERFFQMKQSSSPVPSSSTNLTTISTFKPEYPLSKIGLAGSGVKRQTGRQRQIVGDHIDRFSDKFKHSQNFQPRLLNKSAQSKLSSSRF